MWEKARKRIKDTIYCVSICTRSTICCQKNFENCARIVYIKHFPPVFDFFTYYVVSRSIAQRCGNIMSICWFFPSGRTIWPCHVFRYIWYFSSRAYVLPLWSAKVRTWDDGSHCTRWAGYFDKVKRDDRWWGKAPEKCPKKFPTCSSSPLRWRRYIFPDPDTTTRSSCFWLWSVSTWRKNPWALPYPPDGENWGIWDG